VPPRCGETHLVESTRPGGQRSKCRHLFDGSDCLDADSLQRRPSRARSTSSVSTPSAPQEADSGAAPRRLQSLIIQGGGAPDIQVSLAAGGLQEPTSAMAEVGRIAPEQPRERSATIKAAGRKVAAPESVGTKRVASSRARRTVRGRGPGSVPRCKFSSLVPLS
jgi:hypothetical protein